MRRALILVPVLCAALAAPAVAGHKSTHVVSKWWKVTLNEDDAAAQKVAPGGTFTRCPGDIVTRLRFRGKMVHPSRKGVEYDAIWRHRGVYDAGLYGNTTKKHGRVDESLGTEGGQDMGDGEWTIRFKRNDKRVGRAVVNLRTASGPAC
jgi:hypothetical protein